MTAETEVHEPATEIGLSLYQYRSCPYCAMTSHAINQMGMNIEHRDILMQPEYRAELMQEGGSSQVPCLRIEKDDGKTEWLYESMDIIEYLRGRSE